MANRSTGQLPNISNRYSSYSKYSENQVEPPKEAPILEVTPPQVDANGAKSERKSREETITIPISLPNGTVFTSAMTPSKAKTAADIVKVVCDKVALTPADDYELVEIAGDTEKAIPATEQSVTIALKLKDSTRKLAIRKKQSKLGNRKLNFVSMSRVNSPTKATGASLSSVNTTSTPGKGSSADLSSPTSPTPSPIEPVPQPVPVRRRLSISEGLSNLLGLGSSKQQEPAPPPIPLVTEPQPIFDLESNERRMLHLQIPETLSKIFTASGVENHGLTFSRLAERSRFLSWSKGSSASASARDLSTKVFGCHLSQIMAGECMTDETRRIPNFFRESLDYLEHNALNTPGLFRISGVSKRIKLLKDDADAGNKLQFGEVKPHDVTGLLKMFLREMPEPLLTFKLYEFYVAAARHLDGPKFDEAIRLLTLLLPICNLYLLEDFLKLLKKVASNSGPALQVPLSPLLGPRESSTELSPTTERPPESSSDLHGVEREDSHNMDEYANTGIKGNLMTPYNLAIVVAPNILRTKDIKGEKSLTDNEWVTKVFERMLENVDTLFLVPAELINDVRQKISGSKA